MNELESNSNAIKDFANKKNIWVVEQHMTHVIQATINININKFIIWYFFGI